MTDLPWHNTPHCPQCSLLSDGNICGQCMTSAPDFDATHAPLRYDYPLGRLLQHYKYQDRLTYAHTLATLWLRQTSAAGTTPDIDCLMPMPMHAQRLQERGFNQALEIARLLSKHLNIALDYKSAQRIKLTAPQASLPLKDRIKNIHGVFACSTDLTGKRIAIVDDVMTTGASLNELAKTLKQAGAVHVECWVIARTLPR